MGIVKVYVQATNGRYYENPILKTHHWYVVFDDVHPPEILVDFLTKSEGTTRREAKRFARNALDSLGMAYTLLNECTLTHRIFPDKMIKKAYGFYFLLESPIPMPLLFDSVTDRVTEPAVIYAFNIEAEVVNQDQESKALPSNNFKALSAGEPPAPNLGDVWLDGI